MTDWDKWFFDSKAEKDHKNLICDPDKCVYCELETKIPGLLKEFNNSFTEEPASS